MAVGLGAGGAVGVALETAAAPGTWVTPAVWVPIISESLMYQEDRYYSEAIRQQTVTNEVKQSYYRVEGDLSMEADPRFVPYFLYAARMVVTKVGASSPFTYTFKPDTGATLGTTGRTLSVTIVRNGIVFKYSGCVVGNFEFTVDNGVLMFNPSVLGTTMLTGGSVTPTFTSPRILGATAHTISTGDSALTTSTTPGSAMAAVTQQNNFNGFTFTANQNAAAQNRIRPDRSASYISFGITEATITTELDFESVTDYDHYVATDRKRLQFVSAEAAGATPATNNRIELNVYNSVFDAYEVNLGTWGDLVMANSTFRVISSGGAAPPFDVNVVTTQDLTAS